MESKNIKVSSELSRKAPTLATFNWEVHDFFNLPKEVNYCVRSPTFSFLDAEWQLEMFPNGNDDSFGWICLHVVKTHSLTKTHSVAYHLGIGKTDGTEYVSANGETNFIGNGARCGNSMVLERSSLPSIRNHIFHENTMTVFCNFRLSCGNKKVVSRSMRSTGELDFNYLY